MPKPAGKTINVLRWIFGIPLALAIAFGLLYVLVTVDTQPRRYGFSLSFALRAFEIMIVFSVPVFLSCLFSPSPKKYAALISMSLITLFIVVLFIYLLVVNHSYHSVKQVTSIAVGYTILIAGSSVGFAVSYAVFKNRGWERKPKEPEPWELD